MPQCIAHIGKITLNVLKLQLFLIDYLDQPWFLAQLHKVFFNRKSKDCCLEGSSINEGEVWSRILWRLYLVLKSVTMGRRGSNIVENCMTSFMDDSLWNTVGSNTRVFAISTSKFSTTSKRLEGWRSDPHRRRWSGKLLCFPEKK